MAQIVLAISHSRQNAEKTNFRRRITMGPLKVFIAAAALSVPMQALAIPALTSFSGGINATSGSDQLYGWVFDVNSAVNVTALGAFDDDLDGMAVSHDIGIFRVSDQTLVASTTLGAGTGGFLDGDFRYGTLSSDVLLSVGRYQILMTMPSGNADLQSITNTVVSTAAEIDYVTSAFDEGSSLHYVTSWGAFAEGMFGPNFQFDAAVPEPMTLALMGLGLAGIGYKQRRDKKAA
ncbi:MAG: PEP-CTERM sorting domain-containing protein [Chromatiaceae bacterium]|nr:PEP-CTERM sorting domain-containing protein [Chromatiaceae bacterium]